MLSNSTPLTTNRGLLDWVKEKVALFQAEAVHWCDGSDEEFEHLCDLMVQSGMAVRLNQTLRPHSLLVRTDARDASDCSCFIAERTFICSRREKDAGPTNNWHDPLDMKRRFQALFSGAMRGRTLFVVPFVMGPKGSSFARFGVQLTDSPYVAAHLKILTRMGQVALDEMGERDFVPCLHSLGYPLLPGEEDVSWPCDIENFLLAHFPEERQVWSYGSGYGDNALLSRKSFGLRLASAMARDEGWLAEHMLVLGLSNPQNRKIYVAGAFPPGCGKTNLAMLAPASAQWKVETVSDHIVWLKFGIDERLHAVNPESGFYSSLNGINEETNFHALRTVAKNTIFTNVAQTPGGDVWWEGLTSKPPAKLLDWQGQTWMPAYGKNGKPAAHPNARFAAPLMQCPVLDARWNDPQGVPLLAIIFGARRSDTWPVAFEAFNWQHGVFMASLMASEIAEEGTDNDTCLRRDPFALRRFCGYHIGDYFAYWLRLARLTSASHLPRLFAVNFFRRDQNKTFLWPGFNDNIRVLQWIFERVESQPDTRPSAAGLLPAPDDLRMARLDIAPEKAQQLLAVSPAEWRHEAHDLLDFYEIFGEHLPDELRDELENLIERLHPKLEMI